MDSPIDPDPKIPYRFIPIPYELLTEDFLNDPIMIRFMVCMMRRISPYPNSTPLKNRRKQLFLDPFEFMFGREKFAEHAGISPKNAYTRLQQLIGLGYIEEVVSKRDSNYTVYRLVTEAFYQVSGQHEGQKAKQKSGQLNEHKQETKNAKDKDIKGTFDVQNKTSDFTFSENHVEEAVVLRTYCEHHQLKIYETSLRRWIAKHGVTYISDHLSLLIPDKNKVRNHEAWMEEALKENYVQTSKNSQINRNYLNNFLEQHPWSDLKVTKAYCVHLPSGKDYCFDLPHETFQKMIAECFELYNN